MQIPLKKDRKRKTGGAVPKKNGGRIAKKRNLTGIRITFSFSRGWIKVGYLSFLGQG